MLARTESPALTARRARRSEASGASWDPIVWAEARGANVVDVDGNVYVDLASGFGVASIGHAHPRVVAAIEAQARALIHGFGDVHPSAPKIALLERLAALAPWPDARVILGAHGGDAIEAALKTAVLATGRPGVIAFEGGYHGLGHGPLALCGYSPAFRAPFAAQLSPHVEIVPWGSIAPIARAIDRGSIGAIVIEPIQGRGGLRLPPRGWLAEIGALARARDVLVIADEILVGLGRCGARWISIEEGLEPDLLCTGKALGGGMPISACLGRAELMRSWGDPRGEAIHTATFFGHPIACATALATLEVIDELDLAHEARVRGARWIAALREVGARHGCVREVRGRGMLIGIELDAGTRVLRAVPALLARGWITLPAGMGAESIQILPPIPIGAELLEAFVRDLDAVLSEVA